jgi:hypothetical protein
MEWNFENIFGLTFLLFCLVVVVWSFVYSSREPPTIDEISRSFGRTTRTKDQQRADWTQRLVTAGLCLALLGLAVVLNAILIWCDHNHHAVRIIGYTVLGIMAVACGTLAFVARRTQPLSHAPGASSSPGGHVDPMIEWLRKHGIPVTRENYLKHGGYPPEPLDAEVEAELPPEIKLPEE